MKWLRLLCAGALSSLLPIVLFGFSTEAPTRTQARCEAVPGWLPATPEPDNANPNSPDDDCPFYQAAWQHFLFAVAPDSSGFPLFLGYKGITDVFGTAASPMLSQTTSTRLLNLLPRVAERSHEGMIPGQRFTGSPVVDAPLGK
jgi:hypothetical protein